MPNLYTPVSLVVMILASWRISCLFYYDRGPWDLFDRLRYRAGVYLDPEHRSFWGKQLACFWCVSLWVSLGVVIVGLFYPVILLPFAVGGAAVLLSGGGRLIWRDIVDSGP